MTKAQIIISIISGLIISFSLFVGTTQKINPLVSSATDTFHVKAYLMKGGWPMQVTDQISRSKIPNKPVLYMLLLNTALWIIVSFVIVYMIKKYLV